MRKLVCFGTALAIGLGLSAIGAGNSAKAQMYGYGPGMMQQYGQGYGPGMMGPGYGQGMMYGNQGSLNLSTDDAKKYFERWIASQSNTRLKVGDVKEKDADTLVVDIVTKDNSLVQRFIVNRHSGFYRAGEG